MLNPAFDSQDCRECWITGLEGSTIAGRFQNALFIVVEKLSASGYGLFVPGTDGHTILSCILMITGRFIECYILGEPFAHSSYQISLAVSSSGGDHLPHSPGFSDAYPDKGWQKVVEVQVPGDH